MTTPLVLVDGMPLNDGVSRALAYQGHQSLFEPVLPRKGTTITTWGSIERIESPLGLYEPRTFTLTGYLLRGAGLVEIQQQAASWASAITARPAVLQIGSLALDVNFSSPRYDRLRDFTGQIDYTIDGEAVPGTWRSLYCQPAGQPANGSIPGFPIRDDRSNATGLQAATNPIVITNPGSAPAPFVGRLSNTSYTSTTLYLRTDHKEAAGRGRVVVTTDAAGVAEVTAAHRLLLPPGVQNIRIESSAGALLASGTWQSSWRKTRWRYVGNTSNKMAECPAIIELARTGQATYVSTAGTLATAYDGEARIGLPFLQRRNLFLRSNDFHRSPWSANTTTVSPGAALAPDGTATGCKLAATGSDSWVVQQVTMTASRQLTFAVYLKADAATSLAIRIYDGGTTTTQTCAVTTDWQRFSVTATLGVAATYAQCFIGGGSTFTAGEAVYAWQAQLESGASATAVQPTHGTDVDLTNPLAGAGLVLEGSTVNLLTSNQATGTDTLGNQTGFTNYNGGSGSSSTDAGKFYQGSRALKVVADGTGANQGIEVAATSASASTAYVFQAMLIGNTAGHALKLDVLDSTGQTVSTTVYTTTTYSLVTAKITTAVGATTVTARVYTDGTFASTFYLDCCQLTASVLPSSWIDGTRNADIAATTRPHNYLYQGANPSNATYWAAAGTGAALPASTPVAGPDGTLSAYTWTISNTNNNLTQTTAGAVYPGDALAVNATAWTVDVSIKLGTLTSGSLILRIEDPTGTQLGSATTISTGSASTAEFRTFSCTVLASSIGASVTGLKVKLAGNSGTGTVILGGFDLRRGRNQAAQLVDTTDTPARLVDADWAVPSGWEQNGYIEFDYVSAEARSATNQPTGANFALLGLADGTASANLANATLAIWRLDASAANSLNIYAERRHDGAIGSGSTAGRGAVTTGSAVNVFDGSKHRLRLEWVNYTLGGLRTMIVRLLEQGTNPTLTQIGSLTVSPLYGATAWLPPERIWLSSGSTFGTLSNLTIGFPDLPAGAQL